MFTAPRDVKRLGPIVNSTPWLVRFLFVFLAATAASLRCEAAEPETRPNIIFLLSDDQRFDTLGCMGSTELPTPNLDRLADRGVVFDNFYTTTAICMASRASFMTGMYEYRTGCNFAKGPLHPALFEQSYPALLRAAGYRTGFAGKFGFAVSEGGANDWHKASGLPSEAFDWWKGWAGQGSYTTSENEGFSEYAERYPHVTLALGAAAQDFIRSSVGTGRPFCLSVSFKAPHGPTRPDPRFDSVFEHAVFEKPANYGPEAASHLPDQARAGRQYTKKWPEWAPEKYDAHLKEYYQCIYGIDHAVGMIFEELERRGLADQTVVIYTTDNGYFCGSHRMGGKTLLYEEGSRGPLIIADPTGPSAGQRWRSPALTGTIDIAPTILEMAGLPIPETMDGKSLVPILRDPTARVKEAQALIQVWGGNASESLAVVTEDWKYIYWYAAEGDMEPAEELYNMTRDRLEMVNLAGVEEHRGALEAMRELYDQQVRHWRDNCFPDNGYPGYAIVLDRHVPWDDKKGLVKWYGKEKRKPKPDKQPAEQNPAPGP